MSLAERDENSARLRLRQALLQAPLFSNLDSASMAAIEGELTPLVLPGGTPLFHQGEPADAVYVVASGCLGVFRHDDEDSAEGGPALIAEITPGNIVGEMSLLTHGQSARAASRPCATARSGGCRRRASIALPRIIPRCCPR